jgi:hypothetical protein
VRPNGCGPAGDSWSERPRGSTDLDAANVSANVHIATDGGCRVTERTWDRRPGWFRVPAGWAMGVKDSRSANVVHIDRTLERLKAKAEAGH